MEHANNNKARKKPGVGAGSWASCGSKPNPGLNVELLNSELPGPDQVKADDSGGKAAAPQAAVTKALAMLGWGRMAYVEFFVDERIEKLIIVTAIRFWHLTECRTKCFATT